MEYFLLISSNSEEWRHCLAAAFGRNNAFHVMTTVSSLQIVEIVAEQFPDIIIWEIDSENPLPIASELSRKSPFSRLVIVMRDPSKFDMHELVRAGIKGCLPFRLLPKQIVNAVDLILDAGILCLPRFGPEYSGTSSVLRGRKNSLKNLTSREQEVLTELCKGHSNQEIAATLFISESTVKSHLRSIFRKLGVRKRNEALMLGIRDL